MDEIELPDQAALIAAAQKLEHACTAYLKNRAIEREQADHKELEELYLRRLRAWHQQPSLSWIPGSPPPGDHRQAIYNRARDRFLEEKRIKSLRRTIIFLTGMLVFVGTLVGLWLVHHKF